MRPAHGACSREQGRLLSLVPAAILLLALSGCDGGGDGGLSPPADFVAAPSTTDYVDAVVLGWTPVADVDGYDLQARVADGPWEGGSAPKDASGVTLYFAADAPEASEYGFQIRSVRGEATSAWSPEVRIFRGVRPAQNVQVFDTLGGIGGLSVTWIRGSLQADTLVLERSVVELGGSVGAWSSVPGVGPADTSYWEAAPAGWIDGRSIAFRVSYVKNGHASKSVSATSNPARPVAPAALAATPAGATSIHLSWTPRSTYADRQVITRTPYTAGAAGGTDLPPLGPTVADFTDAVPAPGAYFYTVRAQVGPVSNIVNYVATSDPVLGLTALDPTSPFSATTLSLPPGDQVARDAQGRWGLIGGGPVPGTAQASIATASGWITHEVPSNRGLATPAILFDPQDRPHLLTLVGATSDQLHHEWLTAGAWHAEDLPPGSVDDVAVDSAGAVHAVSCDGALSYITNASGDWTRSPLSGNCVNYTCHIGVGPQGDPRIAYVSWVDVSPGVQVFRLAWQRQVAGVWTEEAVPGTEDPRLYDPRIFLRVLAPTAARTAIVYASGSLVRAVVRDGDSWGAVETVGGPFNGQSCAAASSVDGRLLVAWNGSPDLGAHAAAAIRAATGGWSSIALHDNPYGVACGFAPLAKAWVLEGLGAIVTTTTILYEEK